MHHCCICDKGLDGTDWVCHDCAREWGLMVPFSLWPEWAKVLKQSEQEERRHQREWHHQGNEEEDEEEDRIVILASESPYVDQLFYGEWSDDL